MPAKTVTVTLPTGTRVTCSEETAKKLGISPPEPKKAPAKKTASSSKSEK